MDLQLKGKRALVSGSTAGIGFAIADGCVLENGTFSVALQIRDIDHLYKLRRFLKSGARITVISFHSLEDRIVKQFFVEKSTGCICPTDLPACGCGRKEVLRIVTKKPVIADETEVRANPRARSAKLRVAERV